VCNLPTGEDIMAAKKSGTVLQGRVKLGDEKIVRGRIVLKEVGHDM
jgi:hypothetical protein